MKITCYQYQEYIDSLRKEKQKEKRRPVRLGFVFLFLMVVFLVIQHGNANWLSAALTRQDTDDIRSGDDGENLEEILSATVVPEPEPEPPDPWELVFDSDLEEKTFKVTSGDTLINILTRAGLARSDSNLVIGAIDDHFDPGSLRPGQELIFFFENAPESDPLLKGLSLGLSLTDEIQIMRDEEDAFVVREFTRELKTRPAKASAEIRSSLYKTAVEADMPVEILMQMVRVFSYEVDFQRDIQPGDNFEVLYEEKISRNGESLQTGDLLYASLSTRGRSLNVYRHESANGVIGFYDARGKSVRRTLMVTPVDGARISSGYGMRMHPIQGYNKMHKGLDFAAPSGTPIMAAGDGVVEYAGRRGSYGNYVRIRHPNSYQTVYAHMSGYAENIKNGVRVKQGETIGYVGSTGRSTGPHLHFEVLHAGASVNPSEVKSPPGRALEGEELEQFLAAKHDLEELYASLDSPGKLALADHLPPAETARQ